MQPERWINNTIAGRRKTLFLKKKEASESESERGPSIWGFHKVIFTMTPVFVIKISDELCLCVLFDMMCKEKVIRSLHSRFSRFSLYDTDARLSIQSFPALWQPMGMGPVRIRHSSHDLGWQSSHSVDLAGWQAKMASIEIWIPWRNVHKPHCYGSRYKSSFLIE